MIACISGLYTLYRAASSNIRTALTDVWKRFDRQDDTLNKHSIALTELAAAQATFATSHARQISITDDLEEAVGELRTAHALLKQKVDDSDIFHRRLRDHPP